MANLLPFKGSSHSHETLRFDVSPGEERLRAMYENEEVPIGYYQQFSSYPTAFVVAADVELSVSTKKPLWRL